jgi:hypothetical protein
MLALELGIDEFFVFILLFYYEVTELKTTCFAHDFSYNSSIGFPLFFSFSFVVLEEVVVW